jgi:Ca2+-binding RTX toxin-like protein
MRATVIVNSINDNVFGAFEDSNIVVESSVNYILAASFVRDLTLTGSAEFGLGNGLANVITGNDSANLLNGNGGDDTLFGGGGDDILLSGTGNNILEGGAGADTINGSEGWSVASYLHAGSAVRVNLSVVDGSDNTGDAANDHYIDIKGASGSAYGDTLIGNDIFNWIDGDQGNDTIDGGKGGDSLMGSAGHDSLIGGEGADTMAGGSGDDTYLIDNAGDRLVEAAGAGTDTAIVSVDFSLAAMANVEILELAAGALGTRLTGGSGNNRLIGNAGSNMLDGGAGADTLDGGAGNDIYIVDNAGDTIIDAAGIDTVFRKLSGTLSASMENLTAAAGTAALALTGNALANVITGNVGANALKGAAGDDVLSGGLGNDKLYGGLGKDVLTGGAGKDIFVFDTKPNKATNLDKILDFRVKDDTIWLDNKHMPKLGRAGKLNKEFFSTVGHKEADDYLSYSRKTGVLSYDADGSGLKAAAVAIAILPKNLGTITAADFLIM